MPKIPFELFLILVVAVIVLGVFVVLTGSKRGDAESGRADAEARVAIAESSSREMAAVNVDLVETNNDLINRVDSLESDVKDETDKREAAEEALADVPEFVPTDTADLDAEIEDLISENVALLDRAIAAEDQIATVTAEVSSPAFAQFVGETLSASPLDAPQAECLGAAVLSDVGLDGLGTGLNAGRTSDANDAITTSMTAAAASCEINPQLIFGQ
jgi:hypothetical protein